MSRSLKEIGIREKKSRNTTDVTLSPVENQAILCSEEYNSYDADGYDLRMFENLVFSVQETGIYRFASCV